MYNLIRQLSEICAPSGFETPIAEKLTELTRGVADEITRDTLGNVVAVRRSKQQGAKKLMLCAHMDEVGFIITGHEKGFLRFSALGGVDCRMLPARTVKILTPEPVYGVVDVLPPHILSGDDMDKSIEIDELYIDVGLSAGEAERRIPLGTAAVFAEHSLQLGENAISGKAMDDRACCALIVKAFEALKTWEPDVDLYALFSVQEELGMRGAKTGAFAIEPDVAVVLDVTHAHTPDARPEETQKAGGGAAIGVGPNMSRALSNRLIALAKKKEIPYQVEVLPGNSGTDGWEIQVSRRGIATALISLPVKYMHSPAETLYQDDFAACLRLLTEFIKTSGGG